MAENLFSRIKNWMREDEYEEDEYEEDEIEDEEEIDPEPIISPVKNITKDSGKIVNLHGISQMKVVIVEPQVYEDVTVIADHLKQKKTVIVNLEGLSPNSEVKRSIFDFMGGAIYALDGTMRKASRATYILAPNNVNIADNEDDKIDVKMKKELESKPFFPWQNKNT